MSGPRLGNPRVARTLTLILGLAGLYGCSGGLSCGAGASGCDNAYVYPQTTPAQLENGIEPVDEGVRMRMTQQALDMIVANMRPILGSLLGNHPTNPDWIMISSTSAFEIGGGITVSQGEAETHPLEIVLDAQALSDGMVIEFVGDDAGEPTGIRLVAANVPVGADMRVFSDWGIGNAACDLFGTNDSLGGRPMLTTLTLEAIISPRVGTGTECDFNAPECLKIDVDVREAELGDFGTFDIEAESPPQVGCSDGLGECSEDCSDSPVPIVDPNGDFECDGVCTVADWGIDIVAGLLDLLGPLINEALPGLLESQLRSALDDFDGSPIAASGRLDLAGFAPGVLPDSALDLGYMVGPTVGAFAVNDPANRDGAQGMDMIFRSGFEAAPALAPEDTPVPHPCVRKIEGQDFGDLYGAFRFEAPDTEPLTGVYNDEVYSLGMSLARASANQALFGIYNTGALCLEASTESIHKLTGGAFGLSAGLIDVLTEGKLRQFASPDAPALVALAPSQPPVISYGAGSEDEGHLMIDWPGVEVSFYVLIHERFSRVFAITADLSLDMSVFNDPATNTLRIAIVDGPNLDVCADCTGNYSELIPDINFAEVLEELVGTLLDSALGDGLEFNYDVSTALADALGVPLYINFLGLETTPEDEREFLNVYLQLTDTLPNPLRVRTLDARLAVDAGVLRERKEGLRTHVEPTGLARIELDTDGEETEYFARVDFGMWRGPLTPDADGTLTVRDPKLRMVGAHEITLRGRYVGAPNSLEEEGHVVTVWVDPVAPVAKLVQSGADVVASATDVGSAAEELRFSWQLDDGEWSEPSDTAIRPLSELPARRVAVRAIDPAGNLSKPAAIDLNVARMRADEEMRTQGGCGQTAADSAWLAALLGAALVALRRRRR